MNIKIKKQGINFKNINIGDLIYTANGSTWLIILDQNLDCRALCLDTNSLLPFYSSNVAYICNSIEHYECEPIIKHIPSDKVNLSVVEE